MCRHAVAGTNSAAATGQAIQARLWPLASVLLFLVTGCQGTLGIPVGPMGDRLRCKSYCASQRLSRLSRLSHGRAVPERHPIAASWALDIASVASLPRVQTPGRTQRLAQRSAAGPAEPTAPVSRVSAAPRRAVARRTRRFPGWRRALSAALHSLPQCRATPNWGSALQRASRPPLARHRRWRPLQSRLVVAPARSRCASAA